jgi:hypothetical protein
MDFEEQEDLETHTDANLQNLTRSHLTAEILKRKSDANISARTPKLKLIELLQDLLIYDKSPISKKHNLKYVV